MFRKVVFKKMLYPLSVDKIKDKMSRKKKLSWKETDKNDPYKEIELSLEIEHQQSSNGNYVVGVSTKYQYSYGRGLGYAIANDFLSFVFIPKSGLLAVLGRDDTVSGPMNAISNLLYPDRQNIKTFANTQFDKDSLVKTIKSLRSDDPRSWCQDFNAVHRMLYKGKMTKSNFALVDGNCVLDDPDAQDAINNAELINPTFRYYACPKLKKITHARPKTIRFNASDGVVSVSTPHDPEQWYGFINFLVKSIKMESA